MKISTGFVICSLASALTLSACGGGSNTSMPGTGASAGSSTLSTSLMDAPFQISAGSVTAVNIAIAKVEAIGTNGVQTVATFSPSQEINLLNYQTSPLPLGSGQIPAGQYQQLRFVLDTSQPTNNSVVINGTTYPLTIPSATGGGFGGNTSSDGGDGPGTAGIKVNVGFTAVAGVVYGFIIDFNAAESIVSAGNSGQYIMKPVLVATALNLAGSISGTVTDNAGTGVGNAEVLAQQNGVTVNSGVTTDASGGFQINALPAGSYTLVVNNVWTSQAGASETATGADGTASITDSTPVIVTAGQTTSGITITD